MFIVDSTIQSLHVYKLLWMPKKSEKSSGQFRSETMHTITLHWVAILKDGQTYCRTCSCRVLPSLLILLEVKWQKKCRMFHTHYWSLFEPAIDLNLLKQQPTINLGRDITQSLQLHNHKPVKIGGGQLLGTIIRWDEMHVCMSLCRHYN